MADMFYAFTIFAAKRNGKKRGSTSILKLILRKLTMKPWS